MCTAISYHNGDHYFGRNLDLEHGFQETVTITPRRFPFHFRATNPLNSHHAMIGMASVVDNYPLYYEASNECGLSMAALNFPSNAAYYPPVKTKLNLTPYELIPWVLGNFQTVQELEPVIQNLNLINIPFNTSLPLSPLHWMISDNQKSVVVESTKLGLNIYENPINVLTNNPDFPFHLNNLSFYLNVTSSEPTNRFSSKIDLKQYSRGMGGIGLPGDLSSASRFVRAAFALHNSASQNSELENVNQFFHILDFVAQPSGCVKYGSEFEKTLYSSCCNTQSGIYYYKTYSNSSISAIHMNHQDLNDTKLYSFPLRKESKIHYEN